MSTVAPQPSPGKRRRSRAKAGTSGAERSGIAAAAPPEFRTFHKLGEHILGNRPTFAGQDGKDRKLSYGAVCLFSIYLHWSSVDDRGDRVCYAGNEKLAKAMDCDDPQIRKMTKDLEAAGLVERRKRDGKLRSKDGVVILRTPDAEAKPDVITLSVDPDASPDVHAGRNSAYVHKDESTYAENQLAPTLNSSVHSSRKPASTYAENQPRMRGIQEREEKENGPRRLESARTMRGAVVDVDASASPLGESSTPPPAEEEEGPLEVAGGIYFRARDRSAARPNGGGPPLGDEGLEDEEDGASDGDDDRRREAEALAVEIARSEGRSAKAVGEQDLRRAEEALGIRDDGTGLPSRLNLIIPSQNVRGVISDAIGRVKATATIAAGLQKQPRPLFLIDQEREREARKTSPANRSERKPTQAEEWVAQCEANVAKGEPPPPWNFLRSECPKWVRNKIAAIYAEHPEWGPEPDPASPTT